MAISEGNEIKTITFNIDKLQREDSNITRKINTIEILISSDTHKEESVKLKVSCKIFCRQSAVNP